MDPIFLSAALITVMTAAFSIMTMFQLLRCPEFVLLGNSRLHAFMWPAVTKLTMTSLIAMALLPIEGSIRTINAFKGLSSLEQFATSMNAFIIPGILILVPMVFAFIFRVILVRIIRGRRRLGKGLISIFLAYVALVGASFSVSVYALTTL